VIRVERGRESGTKKGPVSKAFPVAGAGSKRASLTASARLRERMLL
jgi:hypothetical protein